MKNKLACLLTIALGMSGGCQSTHVADNLPKDVAGPCVLHPGELPVGKLGHPIGQLLLLEGTRDDHFKTGTQTLGVDTIDGKALPKPISIWIDNLQLPKGERCSIKGYESIRMVGGRRPRLDRIDSTERGLPFFCRRWAGRSRTISSRLKSCGPRRSRPETIMSPDLFP